jgi:DNA-binding HxlR family transcriptional regulator
MSMKTNEEAENASSDRLPPDPLFARCPSRELISVLASKWVLLLIPLLREGPKRNGALLNTIEGISQRVLTRTLRNLEAYRLVERYDYGEIPPKVEYALTPLGQSLAAALMSLDDWVKENAYAVTSDDQ